MIVEFTVNSEHVSVDIPKDKLITFKAGLLKKVSSTVVVTSAKTPVKKAALNTNNREVMNIARKLAKESAMAGKGSVTVSSCVKEAQALWINSRN